MGEVTGCVLAIVMLIFLVTSCNQAIAHKDYLRTQLPVATNVGMFKCIGVHRGSPPYACNEYEKIEGVAIPEGAPIVFDTLEPQITKFTVVNAPTPSPAKPTTAVVYTK